ncbi:hypothetical protein BH10BAC5_BH10BAC5_04940 [soil metagenome]
MKILLIFSIFVAAFLNLNCFSQNSSDNTKTINAEEFNKIAKSGYITILDVRTPQEYAEGHIKDAVNIDFYDPNFKNSLAKLDKNKTYLVYCRSGNRSVKASKILNDLEVHSIYNLKGGIEDWKSSKYSLEY